MTRFPYSKAQGMPGKPGMLPFVPLTLLETPDGVHITGRLKVPALVDSGSTVNVLPRDIGERFGWNWEQNTFESAGIVRGHPALAVSLFAKVSGFAPKKLTFAWSALPSENMRVLLGQTNFFDEFYVDFRKPLGYFDIVLKD